ncbi:hypothetical protein [Mesorhizobium sp.]|jgi:hypothetical protein|nr:hypothetical protein [Mesorhizobium sp.]
MLFPHSGHSALDALLSDDPMSFVRQGLRIAGGDTVEAACTIGIVGRS